LTETTEKKTAAVVPTNAEIDALCQLYADADKNVKNAIDTRDVFGEQIEEMIAAHGFLPPRSKKSKRIQGDEFKATLSQSHSVDVDSTAAKRFYAVLKEFGLQRFFRKCFRREQVFVLLDGAQDLISRLAIILQQGNETVRASEVQLTFANTLKIESRSTSLKVEPLKEEKKKGAKKAEAAG
jgi:hypothetical protein